MHLRTLPDSFSARGCRAGFVCQARRAFRKYAEARGGHCQVEAARAEEADDAGSQQGTSTLEISEVALEFAPNLSGAGFRPSPGVGQKRGHDRHSPEDIKSVLMEVDRPG